MPDQPTILYIEDNADNQRLVRRIMEARGYTVLLAKDGPDGIALARESQPVLVLVDINIPGLDGYGRASARWWLVVMATSPSRLIRAACPNS